MAVRMREVLARSWVGVYAPYFLSVLVSNKVISTIYKRKLKYYIKHYILIERPQIWFWLVYHMGFWVLAIQRLRLRQGPFFVELHYGKVFTPVTSA